jgi:hypothetical protein
LGFCALDVPGVPNVGNVGSVGHFDGVVDGFSLQYSLHVMWFESDLLCNALEEWSNFMILVSVSGR